MPYVIPQFPMMCQVYTGGVVLPVNLRLTVPCNLAYGKRVWTQYWDWGTSGENAVFTCVLFPALSDVRDYSSSSGRDALVLPAGSGRAYIVDFVDDLGKGFPNEHRFCLCEKLIPWPTPIP
jgi:hypothetical protein